MTQTTSTAPFATLNFASVCGGSRCSQCSQCNQCTQRNQRNQRQPERPGASGEAALEARGVVDMNLPS
jgi:hypothetical protein